MNGNEIKEKVKVIKKESEQLREQMRSLQFKLDKNNEQIDILQSQCPHKRDDIFDFGCKYCGKFWSEVEYEQFIRSACDDRP